MFNPHQDNRAITLNVRDARFLWKRCLFMAAKMESRWETAVRLMGPLLLSLAYYFSVSGRLVSINILESVSVDFIYFEFVFVIFPTAQI